MKVSKQMKLATKLTLAALVGATSLSMYTADASGLTGSYVGIGKAPESKNVVDKGSEVTSTETKIIDYRQTYNSASKSNMSRTPKNNNANGEGVDGVSSGNDIDGAGTGNTAIGFGTYAARGYSTAIGTYASAITNSTAVGAGSYAASKSVSFGQNAYANTNGLSIGLGARSSQGLAIGQGATAGLFYKYLQNDGVQNYSVINDSMAIGNNATAIGGIAIGKNAKTNSLYGVALGQSSSVAYSGTALGTNAKVYVSQGVALGPNSVSNRYSNTIGYVPFADDGGSYVPKDISGLATAIGASDSLKAFNTKYANQITEYNTLNQNLAAAQAKYAEQDEILRTTKGSTDATEQAKYTQALTDKETFYAEAVAATKALNEWVAQNQVFATDLGNQKTELGTIKSTAGAVSVGSTEYDGDGRVSYVLTRQITNVAAGTEDTDAVNVAQLKRVANATISDITVGADKARTADGLAITSDADQSRIDIVGVNTNITTAVDADNRLIQVGLSNNLDLSSTGSITFGTNGTTLNNSGLTIAAPADGSTSAISIQAGNVDMGGNVVKNVGNGSVVEGSTDAVNGGQLYDVQKQITDITGENGSLSQKANTNLDNLTEAGTKVITDAAKGAVTVKSGDDFIKVGLNDEQKANGVNQYDVSLDKDALRDALGTGTNTAGDKNLITGDTLNQAINSVVTGQASDGHIKDVAQKSVKVVDGVNTTVAEGTDGDAKTYAVNVSDEAIKNAVKPELDQKANIDGSNLSTENINNWKNTLGVTNVDQSVTEVTNRVDSLETNVSNLNDSVSNLNGRVNSLNDRVDKVGAGAAALAGLHPLEFNPQDKFSAAASLGSYKGDSAAAIGAFYRPNADTMFSVASTLGDETMFNVGVSLKFGQKGDAIYRNATAVDVSGLQNEVSNLKAQNKGLADTVAQQQSELEQQRALIQQLMAKVGM
ncbi:MAG: YadA-like family protein [Veillonella sp.]|uniref:YadA-like family protein n=1 Tax=Veillonella sp. TaxID=1926307 RepID=UPI0025DC9D1D|nr:YadA-like family protein [Veillonella sp.]MBS4912579.1 YadA-like family protein [Veillonella sp.]